MSDVMFAAFVAMFVTFVAMFVTLVAIPDTLVAMSVSFWTTAPVSTPMSVLLEAISAVFVDIAVSLVVVKLAVVASRYRAVRLNVYVPICKIKILFAM
jgi:hypothetical protein